MKAITFDVYGTLVRFHEAVEQVLAEIINELGANVSVQTLRAEFRATQGPLQQAPAWSPYEEILKRGLQMTLEQRGLPYRAHDGERLVMTISDARPFSEVPRTLAMLQRRARLIFISNTDDHMIARNLSHLTITPDLVVTAEQAQMYKPAHGIFRYAWARAGIQADDTVHVAAGFHHDIEPAHALGIRRVWINRRGETGDQRFGPYEELPDLAGLPSLLGL